MIVQTIRSFAVTMSDAGLGAYVIVDLARTAPDVVVPDDLPHGVSAFVDGEARALEFMADEDDAGAAHRDILAACRAHRDVLRGTVTLVENGEWATEAIA